MPLVGQHKSANGAMSILGSSLAAAMLATRVRSGT